MKQKHMPIFLNQEVLIIADLYLYLNLLFKLTPKYIQNQQRLQEQKQIQFSHLEFCHRELIPLDKQRVIHCLYKNIYIQ